MLLGLLLYTPNALACEYIYSNYVLSIKYSHLKLTRISKFKCGFVCTKYYAMKRLYFERIAVCLYEKMEPEMLVNLKRADYK